MEGIVAATGPNLAPRAEKQFEIRRRGLEAASRAPSLSWRTFTEAELSALPGDPIAVMRRKDGKGFMVVRQEGKSPKSFESFTSELDRELEKKLPDFQKRTGRTLQIKAGPAFFYSYIRKRGGTVHTVVVVPAGNRSYALNTVAQGGEDDVAKEIGRMIVSFDT